MRTLFAIFIALNALLVLLLLIHFDAFAPRIALHIASDPQHRLLESRIMDWADDNKAEIRISYLSSAKIARELSAEGAPGFDAVWPASSLWLAPGDRAEAVSQGASVMRSPVALGLRRSIARDLGWIGRTDVTVQEIRQAAKDGRFRLGMPSATETTAGALAYLGFLHALADISDGVTMETLTDPDLLDGLRDLLAQVVRTSGDAGWLVDALVAKHGTFDAMINDEARIIEANRRLIAEGKEPLYAVYPADALSVADSPLAFLSGGDAAQEAKFLDLRRFLTSEETRTLLLSLGHRAGQTGPEASDMEVWTPDWGITLDRVIAPIPLPAPDVVDEALRLYHSDLRKPSLTVWVLEVSASMNGRPLEDLKDAMSDMLVPGVAAPGAPPPSTRDVAIILPFNHNILDPIVIQGGDDAASTDRARRLVNGLRADGGTDVYYAIYEAFEAMRPYAENGTLSDYLPAVIAVTGTPSTVDIRAPLLAHMQDTPYTRDIPIHTIGFGAADRDQLEELSRISTGRPFSTDDTLAGTLRRAAGYN